MHSLSSIFDIQKETDLSRAFLMQGGGGGCRDDSKKGDAVATAADLTKGSTFLTLAAFTWPGETELDWR